MKLGFKPRAVYVEWLDAMATNGWAAEHGATEANTLCVTIGHLVKQDANHITVALSRSHIEHGDYTKIPMGCVRKVRRIKI